MVNDDRGLIEITARTASALNRMLIAGRVPADEGWRLVSDGVGGLALTIDRPSPKDIVIRCLWTPLLIVDPRLAASIDGRVLDFEFIDTGSDERSGDPRSPELHCGDAGARIDPRDPVGVP